MAKGGKYLELTTYLENSNKDILQLTFTEIESILGVELPESAYKHQALWSNTESHSIAFGWMKAGYNTKNVDIPNETIEFIKVGSAISVTPTIRNVSVKTSNKSNLTVEVALDNIRKYFDDTVADEHGRYMSWRHCYNTFCENSNIVDEKTVDYLALHLAFYLASWGMYRGSSFLLQKDYKVHIPVIKIIQEEKYNPLRGISAEALADEENLDLLDDISARIRKGYAEEKSSFDGVTNNATDTLVTKILLGTLGCVPAYDRYYVQAVKQYGVSSGNYNRNSVRDVAAYYVQNKDGFEQLRCDMSKTGTEYPPMKLMDMCMWQLGFSEDENGG